MLLCVRPYRTTARPRVWRFRITTIITARTTTQRDSNLSIVHTLLRFSYTIYHHKCNNSHTPTRFFKSTSFQKIYEWQNKVEKAKILRTQSRQPRDMGWPQWGLYSLGWLILVPNGRNSFPLISIMSYTNISIPYHIGTIRISEE